MRKTVILFLILAMIGSLCACAISKSDPVGGAAAECPSDYDPGNSARLENGLEYDGIYKMREQGGDVWVSRLSVPSWSNTGDEELDIEAPGGHCYLTLVDTTKYPAFSFSGISKSRDQMIIIGVTSVSCTELLDSGYTIPYVFGGDDGTLQYKRGIGDLVREYNAEFETINDQDPSEYYDSLSEYAKILRADKGDEFTFGYYSGTSFISDSCTADYYYCVRGDYTTWNELPVEKTTNGYFIVDFSSLEPGQYLFRFGDHEYTVIEIVGDGGTDGAAEESSDAAAEEDRDDEPSPAGSASSAETSDGSDESDDAAVASGDVSHDAADWVTATVDISFLDEAAGRAPREKIVFNADGKRLSYVSTGSNGLTNCSVEYSYDADGRLSSSSTYLLSGSLEIFDDSSMSYSYDPQGRLSVMHLSQTVRQVMDSDIVVSEGDSSVDYLYSYEDDRLMSITATDQDGTQFGTVDFSYEGDKIRTSWYSDGELYEISEWLMAEDKHLDKYGFLALDGIYASITAPTTYRTILPDDLICIDASYAGYEGSAWSDTTYSYDDHWNLSEYDSDDVFGQITYEYTDSGRIDSAHVVVVLKNGNAYSYLQDGVTYHYSYDGDLVTSVMATDADGNIVEWWSIDYQY